MNISNIRPLRDCRRQLAMHRDPDIRYGEAKDRDRCCGGCVHSLHEDSYGIGWCETLEIENYCGNVCKRFKEEK